MAGAILCIQTSVEVRLYIVECCFDGLETSRANIQLRRAAQGDRERGEGAGAPRLCKNRFGGGVKPPPAEASGSIEP